LSYVELKLDDSTAHPSDATLQAYFDTIKERFAEPERRHARHILIKVGADPKAAEAKALKIYQEATQKSADFAALAQKYSEDTGSAAQGGDLGLAEKSFFVGPFADAMFAMKAGEIKGPVKSEFGYHIIKLEEIVPGKIAEFAKVRAQVEAEYRKNEGERQFNERQEQLERLAFESSGSLNPLAKALNTSIETVADFHSGLTSNAVVAHPKVLQAAFSADVLGGQNSRPIEIAPGDVVVLRVADHRPPAAQPLEAVRSQVMSALTHELATQRLNTVAKQILAQVSATKSVDAVVTELSQTVPELKGLKFSDPQVVARKDQNVDKTVMAALFKMAPHPMTVSEPIEGNDHVWLIQLVSVRPGDPAQEAAQWSQTLTRQHGNMALEVYLARLRDQAKISFNRKTLFE
jgi:peptidyl-prolyl cis-trans isomerase D